MDEKRAIQKVDEGLSFIEKALQQGLDAEALEKLLKLRDRLKQEKAREAFIKALAAFQAEVPPIRKDKVVYNKDGSIRFKYASFENIMKTIKPLLVKHGLSIRFETKFEEDALVCICIVTHELGHWEETFFRVPVQKTQDFSQYQELGKALAYARRYSLILALGLTLDDEGVETMDKKAEIESRKVEAQEVEKKDVITEAQKRKIYALTQFLSHEERKKKISELLKKEINSMSELTKDEASFVIQILDAENIMKDFK